MDTKQLATKAMNCLKTWRTYEKTLIASGLEGPLKATAVGWKVANLRAFSDSTETLLPLSEQIHIGTVNDRFIGSYILLKPLGSTGITIIKVLQRRPGSKDSVGLDHLDFYASDIKKAKAVLQSTGASWEEQSNDVHRWLSVRFGKDLEYEAKFVDHIVLHAAIKELQTSIDKVL